MTSLPGQGALRESLLGLIFQPGLIFTSLYFITHRINHLLEHIESVATRH